MKNIIKDALKCGVDEKFLASELFPHNKFPGHALKRVMSGQGQLSGDQLSRLAMLLDVKIDDLVNGRAWKAEFKEGSMILYKGVFRAELTPDYRLKFFDRTKIYHTQMQLDRSIGLVEFINEINRMANEHAD